MKLTIKHLCVDEDHVLLERIQRGDELAIASLYDRYSIAVYSVAFHFLQSPAKAEQILTDIFLAIWRDPGSVSQAAGGLSPLLVLLSRNRAIGMLRQANLDFPGPPPKDVR